MHSLSFNALWIVTFRLNLRMTHSHTFAMHSATYTCCHRCICMHLTYHLHFFAFLCIWHICILLHSRGSLHYVAFLCMSNVAHSGNTSVLFIFSSFSLHCLFIFSSFSLNFLFILLHFLFILFIFSSLSLH